MRRALELIRGALGVPEACIRPVEAHPSIRRSARAEAGYPALGVEHMCYIVRVRIDQLPPHAFHFRRVEWTWVGTKGRRAEALAWSQQPAALPPREVSEALRRSPKPQRLSPSPHRGLQPEAPPPREIEILTVNRSPKAHRLSPRPRHARTAVHGEQPQPTSPQLTSPLPTSWAAASAALALGASSSMPRLHVSSASVRELRTPAGRIRLIAPPSPPRVG